MPKPAHEAQRNASLYYKQDFCEYITNVSFSQYTCESLFIKGRLRGAKSDVQYTAYLVKVLFAPGAESPK